MSEKTQYIIELNDKLSPALKKSIAEALKLDRAMDGIGGKAKSGSSGVNALGASLGRLAGPLALAALGMKAFQFATESIKVTREFEALENAITFAAGSSEKGAQTMDFLRERAKLLGLDLVASAEGYKTLSGAMIGSRLEGKATMDIFDGIQVASSVMGLSAEDSKGAMLALGQMMGKGKVQAEELRGQLGERIPGAFQIAARAMGKTTIELDKMMQNGELMAEDFLPKFSDELKKTFGPGLDKSTSSAQANLNRFNNTMLNLKLTLGSKLMPLVNSVMGGIEKAFNFLKTNSQTIRQAFAPLIEHISLLSGMLSEFWTKLTGGATAMEGLQGAFDGIQRVMQFMKPVWESLKGVFGAVLDSILRIKDGLNGFLDRFPIIGKSFMGLVSLLREGFIQIANFAKGTLLGVGDMIQGTLSADLSLIKQGAKGALTAFNPIDGAKSMAKAFKKGFDGDLFSGETLKLKAEEKKAPTNLSAVLGAGMKAGGVGGVMAGKDGKKSSTSIDGVKSGRPTSIYINITKMIETFNVNATNLGDMNNKAKDLVAQALMTAVNNANLIAQ